MRADLRLCWSHIPHCLKSRVTAHLLICVLQVNFEKEPRERYIQLLGYDKTDLAEKVGTIIRKKALDQIYYSLNLQTSK